MWQERRSPKRSPKRSELGTVKVIRTGAPFVVDPFNRQYSWRAKRPLLYVTTYGKFPLLGVVNNNNNNNNDNDNDDDNNNSSNNNNNDNNNNNNNSNNNNSDIKNYI